MDFKIEQPVHHFMYGDGTLKDIHKNSQGETCYDVYFPKFGRTVTVMDLDEPDSDPEEKMRENFLKALGEGDIVGILNSALGVANEPTKDTTTKGDHKMETYMEKAENSRGVDGGSVGLNDEALGKRARKITLDSNGNPAGGAVFTNGVMTPVAKPKYQNNNVKRHYDIVTGLNELYAKKNADYGDSFHETFKEEGMAMARIRLSDKLNRFKSLTKSGNQQVNDESVRDTLLDLANYAIMTVIEMDRAEEAENEHDRNS